MKKLFIAAVFFLLNVIALAASDHKLNTLDIDDIDAGGVYSRSNMGCNYDANRFYVFYPGFYGGNQQRIKVREIKLNSDGSMSEKKKKDLVDLNGIQFPAACTMFDGNLFVVAQDNGSNDDGIMNYKMYNDNKWEHNDHWSDDHDMPDEVRTKCGVALVDLENKLYCFYKYTDGSVRLVTTENGSDWTKSIEVKRAFLDPDQGTIAACAFIDKDKKSRIMLTFANKPNSRLYFQIVNADGTTGKEIYHETSPYNVSIVQGSTKGSTKGNVIQAFYSKSEHYRLYKIEYSIDNEKLSSASYFDWGVGHEKIIGDDKSFVPGAFSTFSSEDQNETQKFVVAFIARFYNGENYYKRDLRLYSWPSDKFMRDKKDPEVIDYDPHPSLCQLIGVIEGPPPYVSNGYSYNELISNKTFPPSSIEYGNSKSSTNEKASSTSTEISANVSISRFGGGFSYVAESSNSYSTTQRVSNLICIEPTEFNALGYRIFMKPIIHRTKYDIYDWDNNSLDYSIYNFRFAGPYVVYEPFNLSEFKEGLNPGNINTYLNRERDFKKYDTISTFELAWYMGTTSETRINLESSKEITTSSSQKIEIGVDEEFGDIFKIEADYDYSIEYSLSTKTSFETDLAVGFQFPGEQSNNDDIKHIHGDFYWIKPTDNMDNWWVPAEYAKDKPWLMTYNIDLIAKTTGIISDVGEKQDDKLVLFPNPAKEVLNIEFNAKEDDVLRIEITDLFGNLVKLYSYEDCRNINELSWGLADAKGTMMPSGTYFARLFFGSNTLTKKFSIIR
jgi:type IX secretion system substrate protein